MPTITLVEFTGERHAIDAEAGKSLMENALDNAVPGIDADCGGACACGTCHCYISEEWRSVTGDVNAIEDSMLDLRSDRTAESRLSCQIDVTDQMQGLVVHLPESQF